MIMPQIVDGNESEMILQKGKMSEEKKKKGMSVMNFVKFVKNHIHPDRERAREEKVVRNSLENKKNKK